MNDLLTIPPATVAPDHEYLAAELERLRVLGDQLQQQLLRYDQELQMAARLQRDFLPRTMPEMGGLRFATYFQPAEVVSGDMYDVFRLDERHLGLYVADAVGHGVAAALLSMFIKRAMVTKRITGRIYEIVSPAECVGLLNDELVEQQLPHCQFASICYAVINAETGEVRMARGGHPAPAVIRSGGGVEFPQPEGSLLGVMAGQAYSMAEFRLEPGDRLVVYSDGLEEAFREESPRASCQQEIRARAAMPLQRLFDDLTNRLDDLCLSCGPAPDDVTVVGVERGPATPSRQDNTAERGRSCT